MKTVGIICEYNPFHLGHGRQLRMIREKFGADTTIVCLMSGNYVQRGLPAMWDKYTRARAAVGCSADLVLELPLTAVLSSAEGFASCGVEVLTRLAHVDALCFGAECGSSDFMALAKRMDSPAAAALLRNSLDNGLSYAAARQKAIGDTEGILTKPNNILGFEYCRAILRQSSNLFPYVIQRSGSYHATTADREAPSATAVRGLYPDGNWRSFLPPEAAAALVGQPWYEIQYGERAVLARLRALPEEEWEACAHGSEGLWRKAMKAARSQDSLEQIIEGTKSKRYPRSRIQRLLLCAYLGVSGDLLHCPIPYVRALAASENGCRFLRQAKKDGSIPILNPGEQLRGSAYHAMERRANDLFTLFAAPGFSSSCAMDQTARIFIEKTQK